MTKKKLITGIVAGIAIGGVLGYLFATEKGAKTREKIAEETGNFFDEVVAQFMDMMQLGKEKIEKTGAEATAITNRIKMNTEI
jgi:gas vesicle protein